MGIAEDRADIQAQFIAINEAVQFVADSEQVPISQAAGWLLHKVIPANQFILTCDDGLKLTLAEDDTEHLDAIEAIRKGNAPAPEANHLGFGRKRFYETLEDASVLVPDDIKHAAKSFVPDDNSLIAQDIRNLERTVKTLLDAQKTLQDQNKELSARIRKLEREKETQSAGQEAQRMDTERAINRLNYVLLHAFKGNTQLDLEQPYAVYEALKIHADLNGLQFAGKALVAQRIKAATAQHKKDLAEQAAANTEPAPDNAE